jgi:hypothetical protein
LSERVGSPLYSDLRPTMLVRTWEDQRGKNYSYIFYHRLNKERKKERKKEDPLWTENAQYVRLLINFLPSFPASPSPTHFVWKNLERTWCTNTREGNRREGCSTKSCSTTTVSVCVCYHVYFQSHRMPTVNILVFKGDARYSRKVGKRS